MIDDVIVQELFGLMCDIILGITPLRSSVTPRNCQKAARDYKWVHYMVFYGQKMSWNKGIKIEKALKYFT